MRNDELDPAKVKAKKTVEFPGAAASSAPKTRKSKKPKNERARLMGLIARGEV